jgi:hypothetical protein
MDCKYVLGGVLVRGFTLEQLLETFMLAQTQLAFYEHIEREVSNPYHKESSDDRPR